MQAGGRERKFSVVVHRILKRRTQALVVQFSFDYHPGGEDYPTSKCIHPSSSGDTPERKVSSPKSLLQSFQREGN